MEPSTDGGSGDRGSGGKALRRYGPLIAIVVVIAIVAVALVMSGGDEDGDDAASSGGSAEGGYTIETEDGTTITLPEGVIPFNVAEREGLDIEWPDTCDTD